jgi:CubicO group peptidase (beta-lactamase class C family)
VVHGEVADGFEGLRDTFASCFDVLGETGAGYVAVVRGRVVAELWGGDGFERDSLVHVYSVTKPMAAFCVLVLADRGVLALDDPVARWWPEFGHAGKERVTVRQALSHQAGLLALRAPQPPEALLDWERICHLLAAESPWWEPGTAHGEHALFYGHICGELVRRCDGRSLGGFWRDEIAAPWSLDFHIGLGADELARAVDLEGELAVYAGLLAGGELDGVRLVSPETVAAMTRGELTARDVLLGARITWGLGVWVDHDGFGMGGLGGSLGMADPELGLAEAYVTRHLAGHDRAEAMDSGLRSGL